MEINIVKVSDVQIVSLVGRLDLSAASILEKSLEDLITAGDKWILLDCADLRYVSSSGLGAFIKAANLLKPAGGKLVFAALNQHVRSVFEMVGFYQIFESFPSRDEALESSAFRV